MPMLPKRRTEVVALHSQGLSNQEIAERLGTKVGLISTDVYNARKLGLLPPAPRGGPQRSALWVLKSSGRKYKELGKMMSILDALTREEAIWLIETLPKGVTLAEYLASMVKDIYAEEHE